MEISNLIPENEDASNNADDLLQYLDRDGGIRNEMIRDLSSHHLELSYEPNEMFRSVFGPKNLRPRRTRLVHFIKRSTAIFANVMESVDLAFNEARRQVERDLWNPNRVQRDSTINRYVRHHFRGVDDIEPTFIQFALEIQYLQYRIYRDGGNVFDENGDFVCHDRSSVFTFVIQTNADLQCIRSRCSDMFEAGNISEYGGPPYDLNEPEDRIRLRTNYLNTSGSIIDPDDFRI